MYHGNWCGPGWSNGSAQNSVRGTAPAVDEFDETCRQHDFEYADRGDLRSADLLFARQNIGRGVKRTLAGVAVGTQGLLRSHDKYLPNVYQIQKEKEMVIQNTPRLRGAAPRKSSKAPAQGAAPAQRAQQSNGFAIQRSLAPVSVGTSIRGGKPKIVRSLNDARIQGNDFIGTVEGLGTSTFGLGKSALLSPAYLASTFLGNLARSFERYRWNRLRIHYVPKVSTSVTGQIIMCSQRSVSEPGLQPEAGTFLSRAMSQGNAVFGALWLEHAIDIDCGSEDWHLVDPTTTSDIDDCIHEELQVYTQVNTPQQCGYLFAEYDISFKEPIYQPHSTTIPISTGPGLRATLVDQIAANAVADDWALVDVSGTLSLATVSNGTIYRMVFDIQGSSAATGTTFANMLTTQVMYHSTTTAFALNSTNFVLNGGDVFYGTVAGSQLEMYTSLDAAVKGNGSGQLFFRTLSSAVGTYVFDVAIVRQGVADIASIQ